MNPLRSWSKRRRDTILQLLEKGPMRGLDLVEQSNGILPRGTIYVWLSHLEDEGLIEVSLDAENRRVYRLGVDSMPRRVAVEVVEAGTHTDEHGVTRGSATLWGSVEELASLQLGPAVLELGRPTCTRS